MLRIDSDFENVPDLERDVATPAVMLVMLVLLA